MRFLLILMTYIVIPGLLNMDLHADYGVAVDADEYAFTSIPRDAREKIIAAMPIQASAAPLKPRRVLLFNLHIRNGEIMTGHPSVPYFNFAFAEMGERTGAYSVTFGNDPKMFRREFLDQFDAIIFNNTAGILTEDTGLQWDLLDYVWEGGGFVGVHAAGATFCQWPDYDIFPEYGEMLGGFENGGHPWKPHEWINLKIDDPDHHVARAFGGENFDVSDEVFQFSYPYSRDRLRVLLSIDTTRTDMDPARRILPERVADGDIAISWVKRYGRGNVFYSSLGHNVHLAWDRKILQHYLDGLQFAMGDLPATTTPSAKITPAIEAHTFKDLALFEAIDKAHGLGFPYLTGWSRQVVSQDIQKSLKPGLSIDDLRAIRSKLVMSGISMPTYVYPDLPEDEAGCREIFEFAVQLGTKAIMTDPEAGKPDLIDGLCEEYKIKLVKDAF